MLWLIALVLVLQSIGAWALQPLVHASTSLLSLSFVPWVVLIVGLWLFSGHMDEAG